MRVAAQQSIEDVLVQGQAGRQATARRRKRFGAAGVHRADGQRQVTSAETHRFAQLKLIVGGGGDAAVGIEQRRIDATLRRAGADPDTAGAPSVSARVRRQHIGPTVGHHQQAGLPWLIDEARRGVIGYVPTPQRIDARPRFKGNAASEARRPQDDFGCREHRALAQGNAPGITSELNEIARSVVLHKRRCTDGQTPGIKIVKGVGIQRNTVETLSADGTRAKNFKSP
ncbi:hypothetical protein D3C85_381150 [compost metagenome]